MLSRINLRCNQIRSSYSQGLDPMAFGTLQAGSHAEVLIGLSACASKAARVADVRIRKEQRCP